jgi:hypothetical protein
VAGLVDAKAEDTWNVSFGAARHDELWVRQEEDMAERGSEVRSVQVGMLG